MLSVEETLALPPSGFLDHVRDCLGVDEPWTVLVDPTLATATLGALTGILMDIDGQLGQRKSALDARQAANGGVPDWAAKAEYDAWRTRALGFRRLVLTRIDLVKQSLLDANRTQPGYTAPGQSTRPNAKRGKHNSRSLYQLAHAVQMHFDRTHAAELTPSVYDYELWQKLHTLSAYSTTHGESSLQDWLDRSRPTTPMEEE